MRRALLIGALMAWPAAAAPLQQAYDDAQTALDAGRFADARDSLLQVLAHLRGRNDPADKSAAALRVQIARAQLGIGDPEGAERTLLAALPGLAGESPGARNDRGAALELLGLTREAEADMPDARAAYEDALTALGPDGDKTQVWQMRVGRARASLFDRPDQARADLDWAMANPPVKLPAARLADLQLLRGRVELNAGQLAAARRWDLKALGNSGGLSDRVSVTAARVRGDLGLIELLAHNPDDARRYLAYSGAGLLRSKGLTLSDSLHLPQCAPAGLARPDDWAVVEIALASSGQVVNATTVYATRLGGPEAEFARAARLWSWRADVAEQIDPFWRTVIRVQVRCVAAAHPDLVNVSVVNAFARWAERHQLHPVPVPDSAGAAAVVLRQALKPQQSAGPQTIALAPALYQLAINPAATPVEAAAAFEHLAAIIADSGDEDTAALMRVQSAVAGGFRSRHDGRRRWAGGGSGGAGRGASRRARARLRTAARRTARVRSLVTGTRRRGITIWFSQRRCPCSRPVTRSGNQPPFAAQTSARGPPTTPAPTPP